MDFMTPSPYRSYRIDHRTTYHYDAPVLFSVNEAHIKPRTTAGQSVKTCDIVVTPASCRFSERVDFFGNFCNFLSVEEAHDHLEVTASSTVEVTPYILPDLSLPLSWEEAARRLDAESFREVRQYASNSPLIRRGHRLAEYARESFTPGRPILDAAFDLNEKIYREFLYKPLSTTISTPPEETLNSRTGVCQDFAHLMIACLRSLGLAARYVSGYIETNKNPDLPKLVGTDASHAWLSLYVPAVGWVDFDPTNHQIPTDRHITVAWGRDYSDIAPLKGVYLGNAAQTVEIGVTVSRL